jgi:hypothetical protein
MENEFIYSEEFQSYGDKLKEGISKHVTLESTLIEGSGLSYNERATPLGCMQEFLDASLVGDKDTAMKKLFAAGLVFANDNGVLPFELSDTTPEGISVVVDDSLTRTKVAYKVATGEIPAEEVADFLIDQAAARAMAMADMVLDHPEASVELACDAISTAFPPVAETVQKMKPVIKRIAKEIAPEAKEYIHEGINLTAEFAKKAVRVIFKEVRKEMQGTKVENRSLNAAAV